VFKEFADFNKKCKFEDADPFCKLVYTDFYKRLDNFFMSLYKEQQAHTGDFNRFNPDTFQVKWHSIEWHTKKLLRHFIRFLKKIWFSWKVMPAFLKKWIGEEEQRYEEALILNITKEKNYVLKYFDSLITDHESYSKQVVLITICLWMTILNRKDFFKAENGQRSLSNRIFTAFQVFTTKSEPILSKNDRQNKKLYGIPADEDDVNSACNVNENDVMSMFIYILSTCSLFTYFVHCLNCIT